MMKQQFRKQPLYTLACIGLLTVFSASWAMKSTAPEDSSFRETVTRQMEGSTKILISHPSGFGELFPDLIRKMLTFLPPKYLENAGKTCKAWFRVIFGLKQKIRIKGEHQLLPSISGLLDDFPNIKTYGIDCSNLSIAVQNAFWVLPKCIGLERLDLSRASLALSHLTTLASHLPKVQLNYLDLSLNQLGGEGIQAIAPHLPESLKELWLGICQISPVDAQTLAPYLSQSLVVLYLSNNQLGGEGIRAIAPHLPESLQKLFLDGNSIGDEGIQDLSQYLPRLRFLQELSLSHNQTSSAGMWFLAPSLPQSLTNLNFYNNLLGDEGVQALLQYASQLRCLKRLNFSLNQISDTGAWVLSQGLSQLTSLIYLDLSENAIGNTGKQALEEGTFPKLEINYLE